MSERPEPSLEETLVTHPATTPAPSNGNGGGPEELGTSQSVLDVLRARRAALAGTHTHRLAVPGYDGLVVLECGPIPARMTSELVDKALKSTSPEKDLNLNCDTLINATRRVLVKGGRDEEFQPVIDGKGEPIRFEQLLCEALSFEPAGFVVPGQPPTARAVLIGLFGLANAPEFAVMAAGNEYVEWARSANEEVDEGLQGEA